MSRPYAPRTFFRHAPNALLARYFHERELLVDIDIAALSETAIGPVWAAHGQLSDETRVSIDSDFRLIDALADEFGIQAIRDEAAYFGEDLEPVFATLDGFHDKAFWTFLERPAYIEVAERFAEADRRPQSQWLRRKDVPCLPPRDEANTCDEFAAALRACFREEGRGYACLVESYRRQDLLYYFAYPEDHARTDVEWVKSELERRAHRPAFAVVFVYAPERGTLDTFHQGPRDMARALNRAFGQVVLGVDLDDESGDERVYNLDRFKRRDVEFVYDPAGGIADISIVLLRFTLFDRYRHTVEAPAKAGPHDIYDHVRAEWRGPGADVTKVGLRVRFAGGARRGARTRTFFLTHPNGCTLRHEGRDALLWQMLLDSGIEPLNALQRAA